MSFFNRYLSLLPGKKLAGVLALILLAGLAWETFSGDAGDRPERRFVRTLSGMFYGKHPSPATPKIVGTVRDALTPEKDFKLMTIRHVPRIGTAAAMPHPYVGPCTQCHLYVGGPGPGLQPKTPVGAALENLSRIKKLGPPLHPDSHMPHPAAGRCIKCHDIIVKVPVEKKQGGFNWVL